MIYFLDLFGTGVFAVAGTLAAGRKRMDVFGALVVAVVTAIGGGTIRDMVLGRLPTFWVSDPLYLIIAMAAGLLTFFTAPFVKPAPFVLLLADAFGLAVFTVIGAQKALAAGAPGLVGVVMGVMTGVAGGILRDVLCNEIPLIFRREIYATASLVGAVIFVALIRFGVNATAATVVSASAVLVVRVSAIHWHLSLPVFHGAEAKEGRRQ